MTSWWRKGQYMPGYVTKEQFEGGISGLRQDFRELLLEMRQSFGHVDERLGVLEAKTDAIIQLLVTRKELHNLTRELRGQGILVEDHKVFEQ